VLTGPHRAGELHAAQQAYGALEAEYPAGYVSLAMTAWRIDAALRSSDPEFALTLHRRSTLRFPETAEHALHGLTWLYVHLLAGREAPAHALLDRFARHDFDDLPADGNYLFQLCALVPAAVRLNDRPRRALLRRKLLPHAGRQAISTGMVHAGSVHDAIAQC
jgi:hypothetical protein